VVRMMNTDELPTTEARENDQPEWSWDDENDFAAELAEELAAERSDLAG